jgi:tetratricopeptide (TPR) repeat protein
VIEQRPMTALTIFEEKDNTMNKALVESHILFLRDELKNLPQTKSRRVEAAQIYIKLHNLLRKIGRLEEAIICLESAVDYDASLSRMFDSLIKQLLDETYDKTNLLKEGRRLVMKVVERKDFL